MKENGSSSLSELAVLAELDTYTLSIEGERAISTPTRNGTIVVEIILTQKQKVAFLDSLKD